MQICRNCGKRPARTSDGMCISCKRHETLKRKLPKFGRRQRAVNRMLAGIE